MNQRIQLNREINFGRFPQYSAGCHASRCHAGCSAAKLAAPEIAAQQDAQLENDVGCWLAAKLAATTNDLGSAGGMYRPWQQIRC